MTQSLSASWMLALWQPSSRSGTKVRFCTTKSMPSALIHQADDARSDAQESTKQLSVVVTACEQSTRTRGQTLERQVRQYN